MQNAIKYNALILLTAAVAFSGCRKIFDVPEEKDYLSTKIAFTTKSFTPRLGRINLERGIFNADNSSFPMKFELINPHFGDGRDALDILTQKETLVWTSEYTGLEASLAEIEAKRKLEMHPIVEIRSSGDLVMWPTATSAILKPADTVSFPQDIRYFDVRVSNSGGSRVLKDLSINPQVEVPYDPADDINRITGKPNTTTPGGKVLIRNYPGTLDNFYGESTNTRMDDSRNAAKGLVYLYIRKVPGGSGNTLRFKFLNKDSVAINPNKFSLTKWNELVHGFNMQMTPEYVQYDVAYPIPLVRGIPTKYTNGGVRGGGDEARVEFSFARLGFGGQRIVATIGQNFRIFEKGDWEIVFHFKTVNPKFTND
ncbi:MAG: DUF5007 domain-containing protein [Bacteroidota bacterium]